MKKESIAHLLAAAEAQRRIVRREYARRLDVALDRLIDDGLRIEGAARRVAGEYRRVGRA